MHAGRIVAEACSREAAAKEMAESIKAMEEGIAARMQVGRSWTSVVLDAARITDGDAFAAVSAAAFGFPAFYGRNMNAWIDCLTDLDGGMSRDRAGEGRWTLTIELRGAADFAERYRRDRKRASARWLP